MKRPRIGLALSGMVLCALTCALLWPHARDGAALLLAQDDPAELSELALNSAVRDDPAVVATNIEAALATNDADLAGSFVELAAEKHLA